MRQKWFTKGEKFTTGIQGVRRQHRLKPPSAFNCRSTQVTLRTGSCITFAKGAHIFLKLFPQSWLCLLRKTMENIQFVRLITLETRFLVCILPCLLSFLFSASSAFMWIGYWAVSGILTSQEKLVATERSMTSTERGKRAARRRLSRIRHRSSLLPAYGTRTLDMTATIALLRSCFGGGYTAAIKALKPSACMV